MNMKKCMAYWSRLEGIGKYVCFIGLMLSVLFQGNIFIVTACVYGINEISLAMFSNNPEKGNSMLTLSLPMSRVVLWDVRMWVVTGIYMIYGFFLVCICNVDRLRILQVICILLFAHAVCGVCLRKREWYLLSGIPGMILLLMRLSYIWLRRMKQIFDTLEHNALALAGVGIVNLGLLALDIYIWIKERDLFIKAGYLFIEGDHYD